MPRASSVAEVVGAIAATSDALRYFDARCRRAARDEQQRRAGGADAPQLGPVAPLVLDAGNRERAQALPTQLDHQAVGVRLRLGDDPGVRQCDDSVMDVSPARTAGASRVTQL